MHCNGFNQRLHCNTNRLNHGECTVMDLTIQNAHSSLTYQCTHQAAGTRQTAGPRQVAGPRHV